MSRRVLLSVLLCVAGLIFLCPQNSLASASVPPSQEWGIGCYDNDCIWISDAKLTSGQVFAVSTLATPKAGS
jgi:hypothetical protein